jgi:hypothetical protein
LFIMSSFEKTLETSRCLSDASPPSEPHAPDGS